MCHVLSVVNDWEGANRELGLYSESKQASFIKSGVATDERSFQKRHVKRVALV
jgi:hypothetical protein